MQEPMVDCLFWSYVFLRVASLFATCMCRMLNLAQGAHVMTSPTLWSRHPFKICLPCLNHWHASVPARVNTECGWPCARLRTMCIQRLHKTDKEIKTRVGSAGRGGKAAICGDLVKYGTKRKQRRGEDVPGRSLCKGYNRFGKKEMCSVYTEVKRRHSSCSRML